MIGIAAPEFDESAKRFRKRMAFIVDSTRARCVTEVRRHSVKMRSLAKRNAPRAFGKLQAGIQERYENSGLTGIITSGAPHAAFVEGAHSDYVFGRRPGKWPPLYPILAWVTLRRLDLKWGVSRRQATFLVRRKIGREGTKAQPHMRPAFAVVAPQFEAAMARVFDQAAANAARAL